MIEHLKSCISVELNFLLIYIQCIDYSACDVQYKTHILFLQHTLLFLGFCCRRRSISLRHSRGRSRLWFTHFLSPPPWRRLPLRARRGGRGRRYIRVRGGGGAFCSPVGSCLHPTTCQSDTFLPVPCIPRLQFTRLTAIEDLFTSCTGRQANCYWTSTLITISKAVFHHLLSLFQSLSRQCGYAHVVSGLSHCNSQTAVFVSTWRLGFNGRLRSSGP